jgi:hypothetical protein
MLACRGVRRRDRLDYLGRLDAQRCVPMLGMRAVEALDDLHGEAVEPHEVAS